MTEKPKLPERLPRMCDIVEFTYGDPRQIGGQLIDMPLIVVAAAPTGHVDGQAIAHPAMAVQTPQGNAPISTLPVGAIAYSAERKALTWRWPAPVADLKLN